MGMLAGKMAVVLCFALSPLAWSAKWQTIDCELDRSRKVDSALDFIGQLSFWPDGGQIYLEEARGGGINFPADFTKRVDGFQVRFVLDDFIYEVLIPDSLERRFAATLERRAGDSVRSGALVCERR